MSNPNAKTAAVRKLGTMSATHPTNVTGKHAGSRPRRTVRAYKADQNVKALLAAFAVAKKSKPFPPVHEASVPASRRTGSRHTGTIPPAMHNGHLGKPDGRDLLPNPTRKPR
jgi:hypothetical protein